MAGVGEDAAMHEFHLAEALADQVRKVAPSQATVTDVQVRLGPQRVVEPESLRMGWESVTLKTPLEGVALDIDQEQWSLLCSECGRSWTSETRFVACPCGATPKAMGGDDLQLVSITVVEPD